MRRYRSGPFTVPVVPVFYRSGPFFQKSRSFSETDRYRTSVRPVFTGPIPVQYRSCIKRAVLDCFSKKRPVMDPYRTGENTSPILVITGLIPVFFTGIGSVFFCALPYRSVTGPLPVRSVPILLHCTVQQKPPQLSQEQPRQPKSGQLTKSRIGFKLITI